MSDHDARRRELAKIHILAGDLGLDTADRNPESEYRSILWAIGRVRSAGDLDHAGRAAVLDHLAQRGKRLRPSAPAAPEFGADPAFAAECVPLGGKIKALLLDGALHWNYAHGIAARMFNVKRLEWCRPDQLRAVVAALEKNRRRKAAR